MSWVWRLLAASAEGQLQWVTQWSDVGVSKLTSKFGGITVSGLQIVLESTSWTR